MTVDEYLKLYPGLDVCSQSVRDAASKVTSTQFATYTQADWDKRGYERTNEHKHTANKRMNEAFIEKYQHTFGKGGEWGQPISDRKLKYWKDNDIAKNNLSSQAKELQQRIKSEMGEDAYLIMMQERSRNGFDAVRGNSTSSKFETKMLELLANENYEYISQYKIDRKFYDVYLPKYNLLIEFDGDFWHPLSLSECRYDFQIKSFHNDKNKDMLAEKNGYKIIRIRESDNITTFANIIKVVEVV